MRSMQIVSLVVLVSCGSPPTAAPTQCPELSTQRPQADPIETVRRYLEATTDGDLDRAALLVVEDSIVFESGGNEGSWGHYRDHHLGPELEMFKDFIMRAEPALASLSDDGTLAVVIVPMEYDIVLHDDRKIASVGTVTFTLRSDENTYLIEHMHWSSRSRRAAAPKVDLMAEERAAYERARPVFERNCASCHDGGASGAKKAALGHFDMSSYPFAGHHADKIDVSIRTSLGAEDKKATMPKKSPGAVQGEDLAAILAWTEAFAKAKAAGLHGKSGGDSGDGHGSHSH